MSPTATDTQVKLTINGTLVSATKGETVLQAAQRAGIDIPALCNVEGMAPWGACRLCLIEVEGWSKLQAACTTWVDNGLVVRTETPRVRAKRESYLKMYLSDHDAYCEAPCSTACPTHIDIPAFLGKIEEGDYGGGHGDRQPTTCPSPASSAASARATASPSAAAARSTTRSPSAPCTGRPATRARPSSGPAATPASASP